HVPGDQSAKRHLPREHRRLTREEIGPHGRSVAIRTDDDITWDACAVRKLDRDAIPVLLEANELVARMNSLGVVGKDCLQQESVQVATMHLQIAHAVHLDELLTPPDVKNAACCIVAEI